MITHERRLAVQALENASKWRGDIGSCTYLVTQECEKIAAKHMVMAFFAGELTQQMYHWTIAKELTHELNQRASDRA